MDTQLQSEYNLVEVKKKIKIALLTVLIPKQGNSYCRLKRSAKGLGLKSHPKNFHQKLTY